MVAHTANAGNASVSGRPNNRPPPVEANLPGFISGHASALFRRLSASTDSVGQGSNGRKPARDRRPSISSFVQVAEDDFGDDENVNDSNATRYRNSFCCVGDVSALPRRLPMHSYVLGDACLTSVSLLSFRSPFGNLMRIEDGDNQDKTLFDDKTGSVRKKASVSTFPTFPGRKPKVTPTVTPDEPGSPAARPASVFFAQANASGHEDPYLLANRKFETGARVKISKFLESGFWQLFVFVSTLLALYIKDIAEAAMLGEIGYIVVDWLYTSMFLLFTLEICLGSYCTKGYYGGFFFWLDIIGTGSLVFDIRFLWGGSDAQGFIVARAGRAARSGTRTTRILRVLRVIRVLKVMRLPKMLLKRHRAAKSEDDPGNPQQSEKHQTSKLADRHAELVSKRVVVLVISMLLVLPATEYRTLEYTEQTPLDMISAMYDPILYPFNSADMNETVRAYLKTRDYLGLDIELTMLSIGGVVYLERTPMYLPNEKPPPLTDVPDAITMLVDTTRAKANEATLSILMTSFIVIVFVVGSFVFSKDAQKVMRFAVCRLCFLPNPLCAACPRAD